MCGKFLYYENNKLIKIIDIESMIDDKVNGYMKISDEDTNLKFEGEIFNNIRIKGREYIKGKLEYEREYSFGRKWNGKGYDENGNIIYELNNGNGKVKEYDDNGVLFFMMENIWMEKKMENWNYIILLVKYLWNVNIWMGKWYPKN